MKGDSEFCVQWNAVQKKKKKKKKSCRNALGNQFSSRICPRLRQIKDNNLFSLYTSIWAAPVMRKCIFGHKRTAKAQISLRIRAVWSGHSPSANRIIGYYRMYQWRANIRMRLCACVGWILCILRMLEDTFSLGAADDANKIYSAFDIFGKVFLCWRLI